MTIEAEFAEFMLDPIVIEVAGATDSVFGGTAYATGVTYTGRLVRQNKMVRTDVGDEAVSRSHFYVFGAPGIQPADRATLADGTQPDILSVERFPDENGPHHEIIYFAGSG